MNIFTSDIVWRCLVRSSLGDVGMEATQQSIHPPCLPRLFVPANPSGTLWWAATTMLAFIYWHRVFHVYLSLTPLVWRTIHLRGAEAVIRLNSYNVLLLHCVALPPHNLCVDLARSVNVSVLGAVLMLWVFMSLLISPKPLISSAGPVQVAQNNTFCQTIWVSCWKTLLFYAARAQKSFHCPPIEILMVNNSTLQRLWLVNREAHWVRTSAGRSHQSLLALFSPLPGKQ